jgi:hypothetical protein
MCRNHLIGLFALASLCFFPGRKSMAQNSSVDGNSVISEVLEEAVSSDDDESDPGVIADEMYFFLNHPINLNIATPEELKQLHLLTEFQLYSLMGYINDQGDILSIYELQLVYGFDRQLISRLLPFIILAPGKNNTGTITQVKNHFGQNFLFRAGSDGNRKAGFIPDSSGNAVFKGKNRALLLRYEADISNFTFGFTSEQDAGESFNSGGKRFRPDFMSSFLEYKGKGIVKKLIIGDYKASWGQGLVLGGFGSRKGGQVLLSPEATGLKKYSSAGENNFFRGGATSLGWKNLSLDIFFSHLKIDAGLHNPAIDSSHYYFTSPDASGLHRSTTEIEKKDAVICNSFGGHFQISKRNFILGFSYLDQSFNRQWIRNSTAYTQEIFPAGTNLQNVGCDFKASLNKIAVFGELASDTKARMAFFGGILAEMHPLVRFSLAYRNYQPDYLGLRSSGFGESQGTKNEEGFYMGLQIYPWKYLKVDVYADHYSFPFLRYNSTNPYSGNDYLLNLSLYPNREFTISMRFRYEKNQIRSSNNSTGIEGMETAQKAGYRLELNYELSKNVKLKSRLEFSFFQTDQKPMTTGFYSGHDLNLQTSSQKYKLWFRYAIYDIPEWENRIYAYENDVSGSFSVPALTSKGTRFIIMGKTNLFPGLELSIRYAISQFQGIRTWGSGNDEVSNGSDSYWTMQVRFKM